MRQMEIRRAFQSLPLPGPSSISSSFFTAIAIPGNAGHRVGKDEAGCPCLLVNTGPPTVRKTRMPLVFENLAVLFDVSCEISSTACQVQTGHFTVIKCVAPDATVRNYFLTLLPGVSSAIGRSVDRLKVGQVIEDLVDLFRSLRAVPKKEIQGLWGELLMVHEAKDPLMLVKAWRAEPGDCYDFNYGCERIEVKTTSHEPRQHWFKIAQLSAPRGTRVVIASILVRRSGTGRTVFQLADGIGQRLKESPEAFLQVMRKIHQTLGNGWQTAHEIGFDYEAAKESTRFYDANTVPKIAMPLPAGVSDVSFVSAVETVQPIPRKFFSDCDALLKSLIVSKSKS